MMGITFAILWTRGKRPQRSSGEISRSQLIEMRRREEAEKAVFTREDFRKTVLFPMLLALGIFVSLSMWGSIGWFHLRDAAVITFLVVCGLFAYCVAIFHIFGRMWFDHHGEYWYDVYFFKITKRMKVYAGTIFWLVAIPAMIAAHVLVFAISFALS